jgi:hypothetical protein
MKFENAKTAFESHTKKLQTDRVDEIKKHFEVFFESINRVREMRIAEQLESIAKYVEHPFEGWKVEIEGMLRSLALESTHTAQTVMELQSRIEEEAGKFLENKCGELVFDPSVTEKILDFCRVKAPPNARNENLFLESVHDPFGWFKEIKGLNQPKRDRKGSNHNTRLKLDVSEILEDPFHANLIQPLRRASVTSRLDTKKPGPKGETLVAPPTIKVLEERIKSVSREPTRGGSVGRLGMQTSFEITGRSTVNRLKISEHFTTDKILSMSRLESGTSRRQPPKTSVPKPPKKVPKSPINIYASLFQRASQGKQSNQSRREVKVSMPKSPQKLDLANKVGEERIFEAIEAHDKTVSLKYLDLGQNELSDRTLKKILVRLKETQVETLGLENNQFTSVALDYLLSFKSHNSSLRAVYLRGNPKINVGEKSTQSKIAALSQEEVWVNF